MTTEAATLMNRGITDHKIVMPRFDKRVKTYALIVTQVFDAVFASSL